MHYATSGRQQVTDLDLVKITHLFTGDMSGDNTSGFCIFSLSEETIHAIEYLIHEARRSHQARQRATDRIIIVDDTDSSDDRFQQNRPVDFIV